MYDGGMHKTCSLLLVANLSCMAATWRVGPGRTYAAPRTVASLVADGDTVAIDAGDYPDEVATWSRSRLVLRGVGGFAHLKAPAAISNGKAIWVIAGNDAVVDSIEFSGAAVPDLNGAGIRAEGINLTTRHSWFHDNQEGILGGKGHVRIENSEFARNGAGDGYSHNLYISNCDTFTLVGSYSHHAVIGHEVKSRAKVNILIGNWIGNEASGTASYEIDLPNGGSSIVMGNMIQQGISTDNPVMVSYGEEGLSNPGTDLSFAHNTLVNDRAAGTFVRVAAGTSGKLVNNLHAGAGSFLSGVIDTAGNLEATSADFVDRAGFDYRLAPSSKAIDAGKAPGAAMGWSLLPVQEFLRGRGAVARMADGRPDVGAWEVAMVGVRAGGVRPHAGAAEGVRVDPGGWAVVGDRDLSGRRLRAPTVESP